jgi:hypothetical protein
MDKAPLGATSSGVRREDAAPTGLRIILDWDSTNMPRLTALWAGARPKTATGTGTLPSKEPIGGRLQRPGQRQFGVDERGKPLFDTLTVDDNNFALMTILQGNKRFVESQYKMEDEFEEPGYLIDDSTPNRLG